MSQDVYKNVNYSLKGLIEKIDLGEIALPELQRPFIWKNAQVRNLFDSLYMGYPVGFFLFWETSGISSTKSIGSGDKQKGPQLLVVDGQQRLTSLFAVVKGAPIIRDNFKKEIIEIAFDPVNEKFEVANATTVKSKQFISNISALWKDGVDVYEDIIEPYLEGLKESREVPSEEVRLIRQRILQVQKIEDKKFIALELSSEIEVEDVAEVFVRINAEGETLKQADFILTLMSVFWEEGRKDLESFSRQTKIPTKEKATAYNHFFEPDPDMLLRAGIGLGFRRARLKYVYSLLTGRDLETNQKDPERRDEQFDVLKQAQAHALNLQNWHDYLKCIRDAGFRSSRMLSSEMSIIYNYVHYLIGRVVFNVDKTTLGKAITQWFFMTVLSSRYTNSPESRMESDLARYREITTGQEYLNILSQICNEQMTDDFWEINMPSNLANSGSNNRAMMAYFASLSILNAKALYSDRYVSDLLDPALKAPRSAIERHHLFPKGYLRGKGLSQYQYNQTANFAVLEYTTNADISDSPPADYVPLFEQNFSKEDLLKMYHWHALPDGWEEMNYDGFLEARRELMSSITKQGYEHLKPSKDTSITTAKAFEAEDLAAGEGEHQEFKSTLRKNLHTGQNDPRMELSVLKTIAGFLNGNGGKLFIGVDDNGDPVGLEADNFKNEDKYLLHLTNLINAKLGKAHNLYIHIQLEEYREKKVVVVNCAPARSAIWLAENNSQKFFIRTGASTTELQGQDAQNYIEKRF